MSNHRTEIPGEPRVPSDPACVFVVDDDIHVLRSLTRLIGLEGLDVRPFTSGEQFLADADHETSGCLVVDYLMPGMGGLELFKHMIGSGLARPTIFISGKADIADSVSAMKAGASDFLVKPLDQAALVAAIRSALSLDAERREFACRRARALNLLARLSKREMQVLDCLLRGRLNKQIAGELGIVEKTVKVHRARIHAKLGLKSMAEITRMADLADHAAGTE